MIEELAIVEKIEHQQVWVSGGQQNACGGCQQKASCTTHAIGNVLKRKMVAVDCDIALCIGDKVIVAIDEGSLLRAAVCLYLLPLIALFVGAGLADSLIADNQYADLWVAGGAGMGLLLALGFIHKIQNGWLSRQYSRQLVIKKI